MVLLCKQKALYVKCCIIANGVTDSQGDTLYREDIKKIFTSFNNQDNFEVYHNDIPIQEVSLLENYISQTDETIGTAVVPSGSWNAVIRVDNPEVQSALLTGEFKGVSLNNRIAEPCKGNLTGQVRYSDIRDAECIIPLLISFVESGANGYGLYVMDYDAYIQKSDTIVDKIKGARNMDFKEFMDGLKSLIKQAEDAEEIEPAVEKEEGDPEEEQVEEETVSTEEEEEAPAEIEKEDEPEEEVEESAEAEEEIEEEAEITKEESEDDLEARIAKLEELIQQLLPTEEEAPVEEEEVIDEDTPKITKSEKVIVENNSIKQNNYYEMTGRDPLTGMKIRKDSKIL